MPLSQASAPTLNAFFGRTPGTDRTLIAWEEMRTWFSELERHSPRIVIQSIGHSTDDKPMDMLIVSSSETIADLNRIQQQRVTLSDESLLRDPSNTHGRIAGTKPVVLVTAGIHATEVGGVQLMPELVCELATSDDDSVTALLDRLIILLVPTLNPDGMELVHDWYQQTLGTSAEGAAPPALYHRYAGHDNNRDWYTHALVETRSVIQHVHHPWRPHIVLDLHQMGEHSPRYVVPPYIDPAEPHVHPLILGLSNALGTHAANALVREGHTGSSFGVLFDCYSPTRAYQHYHGGVRILAEAASARIATPVEVTPEDLKPRRGFDPNSPSVNNPAPWHGGTWRLRDIMDYHLTTIWAVLEHASAHADHWIRDQWKMLADEVTAFSPVTYVIAPLHQQIDPPAAKALVNAMTNGEVRVEYVTDSTPDTQRGSLIVRSDQPFGSYARALLDLTPYRSVQSEDGRTADAAPYDVTSHCLPLHLGVDVKRLEGHVEVSTREVTLADMRPFGTPVASQVNRNRWLAIDARSHMAISVVAQALCNGATVQRLVRSHIDNGRLLPVGSWLITDDNAISVMSDAHDWSLRTWLVQPITHGTSQQTLPRIGVYVASKMSAIDAGWMRLVLEHLGIPFSVIRDRDIQSGKTTDLDVIVIPHQAKKELMTGSEWTENEFLEFRGGLGESGTNGLYQFLQRGGHLVAIDGAAAALVEAFCLAVDLPLARSTGQDFSCPGAVLRVTPDPSHPLTLGMDESAAIMFTDSVTFAPRPYSRASTAATFASEDLLLSGWIHGADCLHGTSAIIDVPVETGRFTGFAFRPHFRAQMLVSYNMLINALMRSGLNEQPLKRKAP